jgi:hypothetical protein
MDDESHFVFIMPVFATELGKHGFQVRGLRFDINHIRRDIPAGCFKLFDFGAVSREDLFRVCIRVDSVRRFPPFVSDSNTRQVCSNDFGIV